VRRGRCGARRTFVSVAYVCRSHVYFASAGGILWAEVMAAVANDGKELVKYMTERFIRYMETPRETRRNARAAQPWQYRWFGMMPITFKVWFSRLFRHRR